MCTLSDAYKTKEKDVKKQQLPQNAYSYKLYDRIQGISISLWVCKLSRHWG